MHVVLWILTIVLAAMYLTAGLMKTLSPKEKLEGSLPWTQDYSTGAVRFIGVSEFLGAVGLVLPWALGIAPVLTPLAALGLVIVQILAIPVHRRRGEAKAIPFNALLLILALVIAIARFVQLSSGL